jgi:NADH:ubiquinone oxidoreductase subunit 5 (subunit L)/multisubunit Na+/H+ antiporter MnhA subunit
MLWSLALLPMLAGLLLFASGWQRRLALGATAVLVLGATLLLAVLASLRAWQGQWCWSEALVLRAAMTPLSAAVAITVPAIALPVLAYAAWHEERPGLGRLVAGLLVFVGAMELLVVAADLLTLLIGWELVGACSWGLIAHHWRQPGVAASAQYAFLVTRLGDLGLFLAAMVVFAGGHSLAYADLPALPGATLGWVAGGLLVSAAAKSGQVPFAPWLFRAMAGPASVSALLHAATMVAAGAYLLARLQPALAAVPWFGPAAIAVGVTTALAGGVIAILQGHAKKLLAASTSAHFGLMWVAIGAGYPSVAVAHLVAHAAFKAVLFLSAGIAGQRSGGYLLSSMHWGRALPRIAGASALGALALAGVPPLGGAWTKEAIAAAAERASPWLALAVVVAGGLSALYAARFQLAAFGMARDEPAARPSRWETGAVLALALASLALGVLWIPGVQERLARHLSAAWPEPATWTRATSLLAIALGLACGRLVARRYPKLGEQGPAAAAAEWFGLPVLIDSVVVRPCLGLAVALARIDAAAIDAAPRSAGRLIGTLADRLGHGDRRWVDAGVRACAALAVWLARQGSRVGEFVADGLPEGAARLAGLAARDARRLQSGLSQHYYALLAVGSAVLALILIWRG